MIRIHVTLIGILEVMAAFYDSAGRRERCCARISRMRRFWSVLFWSVIAAAFIGPGTVTTAASAGAEFRYSLLWTLLFSTIACLLLQESSARVTICSGRDLGQALRQRYRSAPAGRVVLPLIFGAVLFGCAAYEAGNILGGVAGAELGTGLAPRLLTGMCCAGAAIILGLGAPKTVARSLSLLVAVMGVAFFLTAWRLLPAPGDLLRGALIPSLPASSGLLVLGLVGTTVVPYNLFLGSGLARGQTLPELRFGLSIAVLLGGLISMSIVILGAALQGAFSFEALAALLGRRLGNWARFMFSTGLFAAGLSSAITAPLAAAVTARSLFGDVDGSSGAKWRSRGWRYSAVWIVVLAVGLGFGLAGVRPIPAILLAQALNGLLLPLISIFLLLTVNDRKLMGLEGINGGLANISFGVVVAVTFLLGLSSVTRSVAGAFGKPPPGEGPMLLGALVLAAIAAAPLWRAVRRNRRGESA
jgi:Mn2+/Fe2+ NRAMP family transporter